MTSSWIDAKYQPLLAAAGLRTYEEITEFGRAGDAAKGEVLVRQRRIAQAGGGVDVFFKEYRYRKPSWRFWLRRSKARREYENYAIFAGLSVPSAERIAAGEERDAIGRLRSAWILTRAVRGAETLVQLAERKPEETLRRRLVDEVAAITGTLHRAGFFYYDLVWRNILVSDARVHLIDCPRGRTARVLARHHRLRDLASLDKSAAKYCRRTERVRFLLKYLQKQTLDAEAKELARACLEYRRTRWPEDWIQSVNQFNQ